MKEKLEKDKLTNLCELTDQTLKSLKRVGKEMGSIIESRILESKLMIGAGILAVLVGVGTYCTLNYYSGINSTDVPKTEIVQTEEERPYMGVRYIASEDKTGIVYFNGEND
jgi:hypothetical protein